MKSCVWCGQRFEAAGWRCPGCGMTPDGEETPVFAPELLVGAGGDYPADTYEDWEAIELSSGYWHRPRAALISWALERYFPKTRSFFDAGCGAGTVLERIHSDQPQIELAGADASVQALDVARARVPGLEVIQCSAARIPYRAQFDAAGTFDVLEHLENDREALTELVATVKPGGGVLVSVPQHPWLWSSWDVAAGHKRRYRRSDLRSLLLAAGLEPLRITSFVFSLLPAMMVVRLRARHAAPDAALRQAERRPPGAALLEAALRAESIAIRRGVTFPIGGSLLAVARVPQADG